jgi:hypothetical protein
VVTRFRACGDPIALAMGAVVMPSCLRRPREVAMADRPPEADPAANKDTPDDGKKTGTLQIRISPETKAEFTQACESNNTSASEVLRKAILDYIAHYRRQLATSSNRLIAMVPKPVRKKRYLLAGAAATLGIALFAAMPSTAQPDYHDKFNRLDMNKDGLLTVDEFTGGENARIYELDDALNGKPGAKPLSEFANNNPEVLAVLERLRESTTATNRKMEELFPPTQTKEFSDLSKDLGIPDFSKLSDMRTASFWGRDGNRDGFISYEEYEADEIKSRNRLFPGIDQNKDGFITREDTQISIDKARARGEPELRSLNQTPENIWRRNWSVMDKNRDNRVSKEEYLAAPSL